MAPSPGTLDRHSQQENRIRGSTKIKPPHPLSTKSSQIPRPSPSNLGRHNLGSNLRLHRCDDWRAISPGQNRRSQSLRGRLRIEELGDVPAEERISPEINAVSDWNPDGLRGVHLNDIACSADERFIEVLLGISIGNHARGGSEDFLLQAQLHVLRGQ